MPFNVLSFPILVIFSIFF